MTLHNITHSTEWLGTEIPEMAEMDEALRCDICKELMIAPVMTGCSHTFCSLCIRRVLVAEQKCPTCRHSASESQLRRNGSVEMCLEVFSKVRSRLLDLTRRKESDEDDLPNKDKSEKSSVTIPTEGLQPVNGETCDGETQQDQTLSPPRSPQQQEPESNPKKIPLQIPDQHAPCPVCNKVLPIKEIQSTHISECLSGASTSGSDTSCKRTVSLPRTRSSVNSIASHQATILTASNDHSSNNNSTPSLFTVRTRRQARLAKTEDMNVKLPRNNDWNLSVSKLRARLTRLGIPSHGAGRQDLLKRETEWITIWNANADRKDPLPRAKLLQQLAEWEEAERLSKSQRSLSMQQSSSSSLSTSEVPVVNSVRLSPSKKNNKSVTEGDTKPPIPFIPTDLKSLNRDLYSRSHDASFRELTAQARASLKRKAAQAIGGTGVVATGKENESNDGANKKQKKEDETQAGPAVEQAA